MCAQQQQQQQPSAAVIMQSQSKLSILNPTCLQQSQWLAADYHSLTPPSNSTVAPAGAHVSDMPKAGQKRFATLDKAKTDVAPTFHAETTWTRYSSTA